MPNEQAIINSPSQLANPAVEDSRAFNFMRMKGASQNEFRVSGDLSASGAGKVLTFTDAPRGLAVGQSVRISGGTGTAENVSISASTCAVAGGGSGTITVTTANTHTGSWAVTSATGGSEQMEKFVSTYRSNAEGISRASVVGMADIRAFGAVCDGSTDNYTAVARARTAGFKRIFIPANCVVIAPAGVLPGPCEYYGEDWETSIIKSAANPAGTSLFCEPGVKLRNLNAQGSGNNVATEGKITMWDNVSDVNANVVSTGYGSSLHVVGGRDATDVTAPFFRVIRGLGDGLNCSAGDTNQGGGNALRCDVYFNAAGAIYVGRYNNAPGIQINDNGLHGGATAGVLFSMLSDTIQSGAMLTANQRVTTFSGDVANFSMADVSGTFTGNFLRCLNGGTLKLNIDSNGNVTVAGYIAEPNQFVEVANGVNNNLNIGNLGFVKVSGATGAFEITGFTGGTAGRRLTLLNALGQTMTIRHQSGSSSAANRIFIPKGSDFVAPGANCIVEFIYDGNGSQWIMLNQNS